MSDTGSKKTNKILIAVIAVLTVAIVALGIILFSGDKDKEGDTTETTASSEETVTDASTGEAATTEEASQEESADTGKTDCYVVLSTSNSWENNGKMCAQIDAQIINDSGSEKKDWEIQIKAAEGTTLDSSWNGNCTLEGNIIKIKPVEYNGSIAAASKVSDIGIIVCAPTKADIDEMLKNGQLYIGGQLYAGNEPVAEGTEATVEVPKEEQETKPAKAESGTPFDNHGKLSVKGTDLVDKDGNKYQLKGVSTHGIAWFPDYVNKDAFQTFRDDWGANLVRLAMYTDENSGYCTDGDKDYLKGLVDKGVQACTELGMYVIVDWHVLHDLNPQVYKDEAKKFFEEMSSKYKGYDNVIYEICNEPNGGTSWEDVKSYAEEVIPVIRANAPDAIIIVGTPNWSQDVDIAANNPVTGYDNIMYAIHFYAATHTDGIRSKVTTALSAGLPVFVSEFSICDASGNGAIDYNQAELWFDLVEKNNLSYAAWNVSNKDETSSLIKSSCSKTSGWTEGDLSETGVWLRNQILGNN
ncbi:MAG: cellulase family glycosylhydrolase [Clostridium sp.]|nr:cellulase family glycosylhydrolase [Clostridium sp.]MCM1400193.1 cellulase family glycosylhydrolase [Clostridium sp.]MCM1460938.1 cellulase family glycosylhydrolase [Bacteroides sp.]